MVKVKNSTDFIDQNKPFILNPNTWYSSTKEMDKPVNWYFESTCYSGNNYPLFGFSTNKGPIYFYPAGKPNEPSIILRNDVRTDPSTPQQGIKIPFAIKQPYTIGVGIDPKHHLFTVFYNDNFFSLRFNTAVTITSVSAAIGGANYKSTHENVSINFGALDFKYNVSGYLPWQDKYISNYCTNSVIFSHFINSHVFVILSYTQIFG